MNILKLKILYLITYFKCYNVSKRYIIICYIKELNKLKNKNKM